MNAGGFNLPAWSAKNPLGILALFIALIYGMAALLLGVAVGHLTELNQTILVGFLVVFPVLVLGTFAWLVAAHHRKLYGPADYRSDESFLGDPVAFGERLTREAQPEVPAIEGPIAPTDAPAVADPAAPSEEASRISRVVSDRISEAVMAETLVFQELQQDLRGAVRRNLMLPAPSGGLVGVDGLIETSSGQVFVEVALLRHTKNLRNRLQEIVRVAQVVPGRLILAVVLTDDVAPDQEVAMRVASISRQELADLGLSQVELRVYRLSFLLAKFGITSPDQV